MTPYVVPLHLSNFDCRLLLERTDISEENMMTHSIHNNDTLQCMSGIVERSYIKENVPGLLEDM